MTHLWEMTTSWFPKPENDPINSTFVYKSWKDFRDCKPYKLWKPYILSSWSWKRRNTDDLGLLRNQRREGDKKKYVMECSTALRVNTSSYDSKRISALDGSVEVDMLQIVFISPDRFSGMHRAEMVVSKEDEDEIREWLKNHMPSFWKL
jgi:hypothetical protein